MAANNIYPFAQNATGSNILSDSSYDTDTDRPIGNQPGIARQELVNKALKSDSIIAAMLAQLIADRQGTDVTDSLTITALKGMLLDALTQSHLPPTDTGAADAYVIPAGLVAYNSGEVYPFVPGNSNTGAAATADYGPGAESIKLIDGSDPEAGDMVAGLPSYLRWDGTNLILINPRAIARLGKSQTFNGAQIGKLVALTVTAGVATPDLSKSNNFSLPLAGANVTLANPTNVNPGQSGFIFTTQDATGGWALAFGSDWNFGINGVPSFSTAANAVNAIQYSVEASGLILCTGWAS